MNMPAALTPAAPLGIALMDEDHAALEHLLAQVADTPDADLAALLARIGTEVAAHFAREEALMEAHQVPVLGCHRAQHKRILDLIALAAKMPAGGAGNRLRAFLAQMLPAEIDGHINSVDRLSAGFIEGTLPITSADDLRLPGQR